MSHPSTVHVYECTMMAFRKFFLCVMVAGLSVYKQTQAVSEEQCEEFHQRPKNIVARAGEERLMTCLYDEEGSEVVTWDKDMTSVDPGNTCGCQIAGNGLLRFDNISSADRGTYTCNVQMGPGSFKSCSAMLRLAEAPVISDVGTVDSNLESGGVLTLSALAVGDPLPSTEWRHNDQPISSTTDTRISTGEEGEGEGEGVRASLTLSDITKEDRGVYSLHATNTAGVEVQQWSVPVIFAEVNQILTTGTTESQVDLSCSGLYYTPLDNGEVEWERGDVTVTGALSVFDRDGYEFSFSSTITIDLDTCTNTAETLKCTLNYGENQKFEVTTSIRDDRCSPPPLSVEVVDCNRLSVSLPGGNIGTYTLGYREGTSDWVETSLTVTSSSQVFNNIAELKEGTMYDVRVSCPQGGTSSPIQSLQSNSKPPVVVNVVTQAVFNDSGTFSTLQWERVPGVDSYLISWESGEQATRQTVNVTGTRHSWATKCGVKYTYWVAAINPCGVGPFSYPVELECDTAPPALRVAIENITHVETTSSSSGVALLLSFTIHRNCPIKTVSVDIEEQDNNFVPLQTFNYSLSESLTGGSVCVGGLSEGAHFLVCLRVGCSNLGLDSSCVRYGPVDKTDEGERAGEQCQLPTSSQRVTSSEDTQSNPAIPDWGIVVIVVGALLFVALICFLGRCFACQTSQRKNVNFGSSYSLNTEIGGNVPTTMHMHNPRTMFPTRSCSKYIE